MQTVQPYEVADYGLWLKYIIYRYDHLGKRRGAQESSVKTTRDSVYCILYGNKKTGLVQVGEPFDIKYHRLKDSLVEINRYW